MRSPVILHWSVSVSDNLLHRNIGSNRPLQSFPLLNAIEKRHIEGKCAVTWPCQNCVEKDWSSTRCPVGWIPGPLDQECLANSEYIGPCPKTLKIPNEISEIQSLENRCGVTWPCSSDFEQSECEQDYSSVVR